MTEQTEREVLEALARRVWGWSEAPAGVDPDEWVHRWVSFTTMLDAKAYESAAIMLLPEGVDSGNIGGSGNAGFASAGLFGAMLQIGIDQIHGEGQTPALALCAAIEAALAREGHHE